MVEVGRATGSKGADITAITFSRAMFCGRSMEAQFLPIFSDMRNSHVFVLTAIEGLLLGHGEEARGGSGRRGDG